MSLKEDSREKYIYWLYPKLFRYFDHCENACVFWMLARNCLSAGICFSVDVSGRIRKVRYLLFFFKSWMRSVSFGL